MNDRPRLELERSEDFVSSLDPVSQLWRWAGAVDVWIAAGLHRPWRVVSESRTYGEWDERGQAETFLELLVAGNPHLRRLV